MDQIYPSQKTECVCCIFIDILPLLPFISIPLSILDFEEVESYFFQKCGYKMVMKIFLTLATKSDLFMDSQTIIEGLFIGLNY